MYHDGDWHDSAFLIVFLTIDNYLPNSNPKPDLHNINAHTKFGRENPLMFTQVIIWKRNTDGRTKLMYN